MKILMVTSELTPFAKSGGLADAVAALAAELSKKHDVKIVLPRYYGINPSTLKKLEGPLGVPVGQGEAWGAVYQTQLPNSKAEVYFLDHEIFFGRDGIYGTKSDPDFGDNPRRFAFLARGAFQLCRRLEWIPEIMHAHDWASALVPVFLRHGERSKGKGEFAKTASILTIHNLGYQGNYDKAYFNDFQLSWELFHRAGFEQFDRLNFLKAGISCADLLTTVSPTYALETQGGEQGFGLDWLLRTRAQDYVGILNGIDNAEWDPQTDKYIAEHFSVNDLSGKAKCKALLQKEMGLEVNPRKPLIGLVSRLADQKGIGDLFGPSHGSAFGICADMDLQFALLGSGEKWCEDEIMNLHHRLRNFKARIGYSEKLAHLIEAGSDFFLMPSRYEPCGLNQMYSLRYGTLPIVRRTGGLADTVENYDQVSGEGTGFMFDNLSPRAIYDTVGWAIWAYYNKPEHIKKMQTRAMQKDFSWQIACKQYERVYERALAKIV